MEHRVIGTAKRLRAYRALLLTGTALCSAALFPQLASAANFTVTNLNDSGAGSLRQAITDSNGTPGSNTLTVQSGLTGLLTLASDLPPIVVPVSINLQSGPSTGVIISGGFGLSVASVGGPATISSLANQSYTGNTTITSGTLVAGGVAANDVFGPTKSLLVVNPGAELFIPSGGSASFSNISGTGGTITNESTAASGITIHGGNSTPQTYAGTITGTGTFTMFGGTENLTLSGATTYFGKTNLFALIDTTGLDQFSLVLQAGAANVLSPHSQFVFDGNATLKLNNFNQTIGGIEGFSGTIDLGSATLTTGNNNQTSTYFGSIIGTGGLTKIGSGNLTLQTVSGSATSTINYSGATLVSDGFLQAGNANAFSANSAHTVAAGARLDLNDFDQTIGSLAGAGIVNLGSATLTTGGDNSSTTFSGLISGNGGLTKTGSGIFTLSGVNGYSGPTNVNAGTLQMGITNALSAVTSVTVASGATFDLNSFNQTINSLAGSGNVTLGSATLTTGGNGGNNSTFAGTISGSGGLTKTGSGIFTLSGTNTYTGATNVSGGTLHAGAINAFAPASAFTVTGRLDLNNFNQTIGSLAGSGRVTLGSAILTTGGNNSSTTFSGQITGSGGLTKAGSGIFTLSGGAGTSSYSGASTVNAGTLQAGAVNTFAPSSAFTVGSGATLDLNNFNQTIGSLAGAGNVTLGSARLTAGGDNTSTTFSGVMSGSGSFIKAGSGTMTLAGANTYSSGTFFNNGILAVSSNTNLGAASGGLTFDGGTLRALADFNTGRAVTLNTAGGTVGTNGFNVNMTGVISGVGGLTKNGSGVLGLIADNTYTGGTTISGGALRLGNGGTTGSILGDVVNNAALTINRSNNYVFDGLISGTGALNQIGTGFTILTNNNTYIGGTTISAGTLVVGTGGTTGSIVGNVVNNSFLTFSRSDNVMFDGLISGTGGLTQFGVGALTLTADNTYSNGTVIAAGTLQLGNGGTTGSIGSSTVNDGGTLAFNRSNLLTFNALISGTGAVQQNGTGTTVLTANNTYTGGTTINAGTLQIGNGSRSGSIVGDVTNNGTLAFNRSDVNFFNGAITGTGALNQIGTGNATLTANNTYTGGTTISSGAITLGNPFVNGGTTGTIVGNVIDNGFLAVNRSNAVTLGGVISGSGQFFQIGDGTTTLTGTNTYTGGTIIGAGTLQLGSGGTTGAIVGNVINNGTLAFNRSDAVTFSGVISGSFTGAVQQIGTGSTNLTATNTYTGPTTVNAGTLFVNGSIASSSSLTVNAGGTIGGNGALPKTTINGGTLSPGNSIGTISVAGSLSFVGAGNYIVEVSPSAADRTNVSGTPGTAALAGTLSAVGTGGTYTVGTRYTVLNATGGVSGTFGTLATSGNFGSTRPRLEYDANNVTIVLDQAALSLAGLTPNETAVATSINTALQRGGAQPAVFSGLFNLTAAQLPAALDQLSGEVHA